MKISHNQPKPNDDMKINQPPETSDISVRHKDTETGRIYLCRTILKFD